MKRKILLLAAALMMFMGVVSASSINGDYKGNPIVKVMSSGKQLETDEVPAHIIDGHTLVPISLLRQLGASVTWDTYSYTVDVKLPATSDNNSAVSDDIKKIKLYMSIAERYRALMAIGNILYISNHSLVNAYTQVNTQFDNSKIDPFKRYIDTTGGLYNDEREKVSSIITEASNNGIDLSDMNGILNDLLNSLIEYNKGIDSLRAFSKNRNKQDSVDVQKYADSGFDYQSKAVKAATPKYFEFYNKAQNY